MKLFSTFVLLGVLLSFIGINAADDVKKYEQEYIDGIVEKAAKDVGTPEIDRVNERSQIDGVQQEFKDKRENFSIASKDIPIEHEETENEEETDNSDKMFEEKENIAEPMNPEILIDPKDVDKIKEPSMQRLARQLSNFRGRQVFHMNAALHNALEHQAKTQQLEVDDDAVAEERAVRRRKRVRRRNTKNRVNRVQNNRHSANRKNTRRRKQSNKNSIRRNKNSHYRAKRTKNKRNKKNGVFYKNGVRRGNRNKVKSSKAGKRRLNTKNGQRLTNKKVPARRRKSRKSKIDKKNKKNNKNEYKGSNTPRKDDKELVENLDASHIVHAISAA